MPSQRCLLISNSFSHGGGYLEHCAEAIKGFLGSVKRITFVPYAAHEKDWDRYTAMAREAFARMEIEVVGIHEDISRQSPPSFAQALFVGGGNTFRLLKTFGDVGLGSITGIQDREVPYIGVSAGANLACPTIRTTNDMPIVEPTDLNGLNLVPFQINPHFVDADPTSKHMGETREKRIAEFHEEDENTTPVVGLREGAWITMEDDEATLGGTNGAKIFVRGEPSREWDPVTVITWKDGQPMIKR